MKCPSCNQLASSPLKNIFSLQGVSFTDSIKGFLKCQQCGTLLRIVRYGNGFWFFTLTTTTLLALFVALYHYVLPMVGIGVMTAIWVIIVLLSAYIFTIGSWKSAQLEKVDTDTPAKTDSITTPSA